MSSRARLKDVAARAGVSVKTVSNVVNGYEHVTPGTRKKVEEALGELGYVPNLAARGLRNGRSGVIALALPELHAPYFAEIAHHVVRAAAERGWTVLVDETEGRLDRERQVAAGIRAHLIDGLILSHSHRDHYGGLVGFVEQYRGRMRPELKLYTGGDLTFREKWNRGRDGERPVSMGALDGVALQAAHVETVCCDHAHTIGGAFTSGPIARTSFEHVLPNTLVEPTPEDHFTEEERRGRLVPDKHPDEHATCYVVQGRGLVVISSCGHSGIVNTVKSAMAVSGVDKLHAVIGGFHLGVAPNDYIEHTVAELKALAPELLVPMHCTGKGFIAAALREMPGQTVLTNTGSRFTFGV